MLKEREIKKFGYSSDDDINDAFFLLTDLNTNGVNLECNKNFVDQVISLMSSDLVPKAEEIVKRGLRSVLTGEETSWEIAAIQPLPGLLRLRFRHGNAQSLYVDRDYAVMSGKDRREAKKILKLFDFYEVDIELRQNEKPGIFAFFSLGMVNSNTVTKYKIEPDKTTIEFCVGGDEYKYVFTWANPEHTEVQLESICEVSL